MRRFFLSINVHVRDSWSSLLWSLTGSRPKEDLLATAVVSHSRIAHRVLARIEVFDLQIVDGVRFGLVAYVDSITHNVGYYPQVSEINSIVIDFHWLALISCSANANTKHHFFWVTIISFGSTIILVDTRRQRHLFLD